MTDKRTSPTFDDRIRQALDAYGADTTRWPADARAAWAASAAGRADLLLDHERARALDRLLDAASPPVTSAALADRIVAAAVAGPRVDGLDARVGGERSHTGNIEGAAIIPMPVRVPGAARTPAIRRARDAAWPAALLAASLVLGIFLGTSTYVAPSIDGLAEAAGLIGPSTDVAGLVLGDDALYDSGEAL